MFGWLHRYKLRRQLKHMNDALERNYDSLDDSIQKLQASTDEDARWQILFKEVYPCISNISDYLSYGECEVWTDSALWNDLAMKIDSCMNHSAMPNNISLDEIIESLKYLQNYCTQYISFCSFLERPFDS